MTVHYIANITVGGLLIPESRKIADLLLRKVTAEDWKTLIREKNILQKLSVSSSKRVASFIRTRLEMMTPDLWEMVRDGDGVLTKQALFAAAIKHCRILGDYQDIVVREQFKRMEDRLSSALWEEFVVSCKQRDPLMKDFPPSTALKMRRVVHRILSEVGYLEKSRQWMLRKVEIVPEIIDYLKNNKESYVLKCIQVSQ